MPAKPSADLGMFVSGVVVDDGMDSLSLRHLGLDGVEEPNELLMAMALHVVPDNSAIEHVEGGEQRGGAVALVVMRHSTGAARLDRQAGLSGVEGLDLAIFIDREGGRLGGLVH